MYPPPLRIYEIFPSPLHAYIDLRSDLGLRCERGAYRQISRAFALSRLSQPRFSLRPFPACPSGEAYDNSRPPFCRTTSERPVGRPWRTDPAAAKKPWGRGRSRNSSQTGNGVIRPATAGGRLKPTVQESTGQASLRRFLQHKGAFPNDEAIFKLLWLGLREASKKWKRPIRDWKAALNQFVILYGDRVPIEQ